MSAHCRGISRALHGAHARWRQACAGADPPAPWPALAAYPARSRPSLARGASFTAPASSHIRARQGRADCWRLRQPKPAMSPAVAVATGCRNGNRCHAKSRQEVGREPLGPGLRRRPVAEGLVKTSGRFLATIVLTALTSQTWPACAASGAAPAAATATGRQAGVPLGGPAGGAGCPAGAARALAAAEPGTRNSESCRRRLLGVSVHSLSTSHSESARRCTQYSVILTVVITQYPLPAESHLVALYSQMLASLKVLQL